ncbi:MAG: carbon storage regulator [Psittacicella sp.]
MLITTTKIGDKIIIDKNVVIEIKEVKGKLVTLYISAPKEIKIIKEDIK